jgi:seryl-tRNA synthetase
MRTINDQLRSILENDEELTKVEEEVKAASARQKQRKTTLANNAESMQLKYKLKEIKENLKDIEESLSNHLLNLYQITGSKEFDTDDGGKREFDVRAKLRGKKKQE